MSTDNGRKIITRPLDLITIECKYTPRCFQGKGLQIITQDQDEINRHRAEAARRLGRTTLRKTDWSGLEVDHTGWPIKELEGCSLKVRDPFTLVQKEGPWARFVEKPKPNFSDYKFRLQLWFREPRGPQTSVVPPELLDQWFSEMFMLGVVRVKTVFDNPDENVPGRRFNNLVLNFVQWSKGTRVTDEMTNIKFDEELGQLALTHPYGMNYSFGKKVEVEKEMESISESVSRRAEAGTLPAPPSKIVPHYRPR